jgi:hypothetical protein
MENMHYLSILNLVLKNARRISAVLIKPIKGCVVTQIIFLKLTYQQQQLRKSKSRQQPWIWWCLRQPLP